MLKGSGKVTIQCTHAGCDNELEIPYSWTHDPGCRYTKNGDGWPESWELDYDLDVRCDAGHEQDNKQLDQLIDDDMQQQASDAELRSNRSFDEN